MPRLIFKMIHIAFIYKNSCVAKESVDAEFNEVNRNYVYDDVASGAIPRPANYDRIKLTPTELKDTLWVK